MIEDEVQLDGYFAHESLDRMYVVMDMFETYVQHHQFVRQTPHLFKMADELQDQLYKMYNAISIEGDRYYGSGPERNEV